MYNSLGSGTAREFSNKEYLGLDLKDKRLVRRAQNILETLQKKLGSCIRKVFLEPCEARQAYDFFF